MSTECLLLYVTASSAKEAQRIARETVEQKLAACANIIPGMKSVYRWQGAVEEADEWVVILKTSKEMESACITEVVNLHSYECPCVVSLNISGGNPGYLSWLGEQVQ